MSVIINLLLLLDFPFIFQGDGFGILVFILYGFICITIAMFIILCKFIYKYIKAWKHKHI